MRRFFHPAAGCGRAVAEGFLFRNRAAGFDAGGAEGSALDIALNAFATSASRDKFRQPNGQGLFHHVEFSPSDQFSIHDYREVRSFLVAGIQDGARPQVKELPDGKMLDRDLNTEPAQESLHVIPGRLGDGRLVGNSFGAAEFHGLHR
jgi:hypothetical protein